MKYRKYPYLKKYSNGYYYAHYRDANGLLHRRSLKTRDELKAMTAFTKLLRDVDRGVLGFHRVPQRFPLSQAAEKYLAEGTADLSPETVRRHECALRIHVLPFFKRSPLAGVTPKKVARYIRRRQEQGAPPNTLHKELAALSAVFNYALGEEWVHSNPVHGVKKPKIQVRKHRHVPTKKELQQILNELFPPARRVFLAYCLTGCRLRELAAACVADVDWDRGFLKVTRKGGQTDLVVLTSALRAILEEEFAERSPSPSEPLFVNSRGNAYTTLRKPLDTACRRAGIPHVTHHALRHAYATILHEDGVPMHTISRLLGHSSLQVTEKVYVHWKHDDLREDAEKICEVFANPAS